MTSKKNTDKARTRRRKALPEDSREPPATVRAWRRVRARVPVTFALDMRSLALFRAALGAILFFHLCGWFGDIGSFLTDTGVLPRGVLAGHSSWWRLSLHAANGQAGFEIILLLVALAAAAALFIGWRSRFAAVVSFVLYVSLLNRVPILVAGGDILLAALLFWCCFLPTAEHWSVDSALAETQSVQRTSCKNRATAAVMLQVAIAAVFTSAMAGSGGPLGHMLQQPAWLSALGRWIVVHGLLSPWMQSAALWIGILAPFVLFTPVMPKPLKALAWLALAALQIAAIVMFHLGVAPWVMLAGLCVFIPAGAWKWAENQLSSRGSLQIFHDIETPMSYRWQKLWCEFLILPHAQLNKAQDSPRTATLLEANQCWIAIDSQSRAHLGANAGLAMLRHSPLFGLAGALLAKIRADVPLDWLRRKYRLHGLPLPGTGTQPLRGPLPRGLDRVCGIILILVLAWNAAAIAGFPNTASELLSPPLRLLRLDQRWAHYLPQAPELDGWIMALGHNAHQQNIEVLSPDVRSNIAHVNQATLHHKGSRWLTWDAALLRNNVPARRPRYARYLCKQWNAGLPEQQRISGIALIYMVQDRHTGKRGHNALEQRTLWSGPCTPAIMHAPVPEDTLPQFSEDSP